MRMFNQIVEAFKAWRRDEVRIAGAGTSGRVYRKKNDTSDPAGRHKAPARGEVSMSKVVIRNG